MSNRIERHEGHNDVERCIFCRTRLGPGEGFYAIASQGSHTGQRLVFCDAQCMWKWDASGSQLLDYRGNQGFNLDEDRLWPRR